MGLLDIFRRGKQDDATSGEAELDPLQDLVLAKLRVGFLVDYDLKTWQVTERNTYTFDEGAEQTEEWELLAGREKRFLERSGDIWSLARKIPIGSLDGDVRQHILEHEDPPEEVIHKGHRYYLDASLAGYMQTNGVGPKQPLIRWEMLDEEEERFLSIEQWGESELAAATGQIVGEYEFTNILPGGSLE